MPHVRDWSKPRPLTLTEWVVGTALFVGMFWLLLAIIDILIGLLNYSVSFRVEALIMGSITAVITGCAIHAAIWERLSEKTQTAAFNALVLIVLACCLVLLPVALILSR